MTKTQINKAAAKMVSKIEWDAPETTIMSLRTQADEAFGTDEGKVLDAAVALIEAKEGSCKKAFTKLINDLNTFGLQHFEDSNVASENMPLNIVEGTVTFWATFYNACCQVVMVHAEDKGIDINAKLGYAIY